MRCTHDLTAPDALVPGTHICAECRRAQQRAYRRKRAAAIRRQRDGCCARGHLLTAATSRWVQRRSQRRYRICLICVQLSRGSKGGAVPRAVIRSEQDQTRRILELYDQRERAATHWDREAITQQIEALRA